MDSRKRLIVIGLVGLILYGAVKTGLVWMNAQKVLPMATPESLGMAGPLMETVTVLEAEIGERMAYDVQVQNDPLKLSRIIGGRKRRGLGRAEIAENLNKLRLSCTIISPRKTTAIIKHRGKSYVVGVGDRVAGRQVLSIDKKKVIMRYQGRDVVLYNRPAPLAEIKYETKVTLDKLEL